MFGLLVSYFKVPHCKQTGFGDYSRPALEGEERHSQSSRLVRDMSTVLPRGSWGFCLGLGHSISPENLGDGTYGDHDIPATFSDSVASCLSCSSAGTAGNRWAMTTAFLLRWPIIHHHMSEILPSPKLTIVVNPIQRRL